MCCGTERWKRVLLTTFLCTVLVYAILVHRIQLSTIVSPPLPPLSPSPSHRSNASGGFNAITATTEAHSTLSIITPETDAPNQSVLVNPHPYSYILNKPRLCDVPAGGELLLVVLVPSGSAHFQQRKVIRATWGSASINHGFKVAFLLGYPRIKALQPMIVAEDNLYHDIIQEDFTDAYANLAIKSVMMVRWVAEHCVNAKFVLKIDDDMLFNVWGLWAELQTTLRNFTKTMWGMLALRWAPNRNSASKWYLPVREYKWNTLPPFLTGPAYLFTRDCAPLLYTISLTVPYIHLEDVFLTGMVAQKARIRRVHHAGFLNYARLFQPCAKPYQIASHGYRPATLQVIWKSLAVKNSTFRCNLTIMSSR